MNIKQYSWYNVQIMLKSSSFDSKYHLLPNSLSLSRVQHHLLIYFGTFFYAISVPHS